MFVCVYNYDYDKNSILKMFLIHKIFTVLYA